MSNANVYKSHETDVSGPMSTVEKMQMQAQGGVLNSTQGLPNYGLQPFNLDGTEVNSDYRTNDGMSG